MADHLGFYNTSSSRTHVRFQFSTHASAGGNVAPLSAIDAADIRIYKALDGAAFSATQRASSNGITVTSPFDTLTGFHDVDIDLTDNSDASYYVSGFYSVVFAPDTETIDSQTITGVVLAYFEIGPQPVNVTHFGGTAGTFSSGRPEVNTTHAAGTAWGSGAITAGAIADGAIDAATFAAGAITSTVLAADCIGASQLAADCIGASELAAGAVTEIQSGLSTLSEAGVRTAVGLASANLDTQLSALGGDTAGTTTLLSRLTSTRAGYLDNLSGGAVALATGVTVSDKTGFSLAAAGLDQVVIETGTNLRQAISIIGAGMAGVLSGAGTSNITMLGLGVATTRIAATVDGDGNRTGITLSKPA